ncbi:MAG TPA: helix-turn-helix domain-containing protein, partial [Spirochaetia bacterium]|nr:helix-turn-helix domain-containing protein [Spirochaetia bacterium]
MPTGKALTPSEVADRLQVAKNTVYELIKRGDLRGYRVGNQVRVNEADLEAYRGGPLL